MLLITGATGLTGNAIVSRLAARDVPFRVLARNVEKARANPALASAEIVAGDMARPESLAPALRGIDRAMLISSSDPAMFDVQRNFIDAARAAGVPYVVKLSGIMPDRDSAFRFARMHGEAEKHLEDSGLAFTHLRGGEFMPAYFRQVPNIVGKGILALPMKDAKIACLDIGDLADVAVHVLTTAGHEAKIYRLTGPEALAMAEVAERLSAVVGKPVRYIDVDPEEAKQRQLAAGVPPYTADALAELFAERRNGKESEVFRDVETLLGRPATTFAEFAARNAAIFRGEAPPPRV